MTKYKTEITVFLAAFLASAAFFTLLFIFRPEMVSAPQGDYTKTAENFVNYGVFSSLPGSPPPVDNWRTPIYTFFLSFFIWLKIPLFLVSVVQGLLFALSAASVYFFGKKIFEERVAKIAAFIFALEPTAAFLSNMQQSEIFFLPFFVPAIFLILLYIKESKPRHLYFSSVFLGFAIYIRPITIFIFLFAAFLICSFAIFKKHKPFPATLKEFLFAFLIIALILSPWVVRNKLNFGTFQISSLTGSASYDYALMFGNWLGDDEAVTKMQNQIAEALKPFPLEWYLINPRAFKENNESLLLSLQDGGILKFSRGDVASKVGEVGQDFIKRHPVKYLAYNFIHQPRLFYDDSYKDFIELFVSLRGDRHFRGLSYYIINLKFQEIPAQIKNNALLIGVGIIPKIFFALVFLLALCNLFLIRGRDPSADGREMAKITIFLIGLLFLYSTLVSPAGLARYRLPFNPFIFLLAFSFLSVYIKQLLGRRPL